MNQTITTGTLEPFNESSSNQENKSAFQYIKQQLREQECRLMNQAMSTGT
jgi:hypothetical protein